MVTFSKLGEFGRLGNQLFQISILIGYSKRYKCKWGINNWEYRKFFKYNFPFYNQKSINKYVYYNFEHKDVPNLGENVDFLGYFQSEKYFENCKNEIQKIFTPKEYIIKKIKEKSNIKFGEKECAIHVRRGDYVQSNNFIGKEYYTKAIKRAKYEGVEKFYILSDEISWCKDNFIGKEFNFINLKNNNLILSKNRYNDDINDIEDLFFITLFKNVIIANSSFSWWGAYLGCKKKVFCPLKPFEKDNLSTYYPEKWIKI